MIWKTSSVIAAWLCLLAATPTVAETQCIFFPVGVGPEQVCAVIVYPDDPIMSFPGSSVAIPYVEFQNYTLRDMNFRIEAAGDNISGVGLTAGMSPNSTFTFTNEVLFTVNDSTPFRTLEEVRVGWSAFGSVAGEPDYVITVERAIELRVDGLDSDGDGLLDSWEIEGYDADGDGVIDVDLPAMGADWRHKDIFVELDWEVGRAPIRESIEVVKEAFAMAPIDAGGTPNPDGQPGINLWVDTGGLSDANGLVGDDLGGGNELLPGPWTFGARRCVGGIDDNRICKDDNPCDSVADGDKLGRCDEIPEFYHAKADNFDPKRKGIFRYGIATASTGGGQGELGGDDFWIGATRDVFWAGVSFMHELGHTLNLGHGGNQSRNCKPNYISIMNYRYPYLTLSDGGTRLDYSPARLSTGGRAAAPLRELDEASLDETVALDPTDAEHRISYVGPPETCYALCDGGPRDGDGCVDNDECADADNPSASGTCEGLAGGTCSEDSACGGGRCGGLLRTALPDQPIDFNEVGGLEVGVRQNIDYTYGPGICANEGFAAEITSLTSHDDWFNISLPFWFFGDTLDGPINPVPATDDDPDDPMLTQEQGVAFLEEINTTNLAIVKTGPAGPVEAAEDIELEYELVVSNLGPHHAGLVVVQDMLPSGFELTAPDERCSEPSLGVVLCTIEALQVGASTSVAIRVAGQSLCNENGLPEAIVNLVSVENRSDFAGEDVDPADNQTMFTTLVVDTTPPEVFCNAPPTINPPEAGDDKGKPNKKNPEPDPVPIMFTATSTDSCDGGLVAPTVHSVDCFSFTKKGLRIDRTDECIVTAEGDTITISDSGGVGAFISWIIEVTDASGRTGSKDCTVEVVNPNS